VEPRNTKEDNVYFSIFITPDVPPHNCLNEGIEVHGHLQCSSCGRVIESCCEGGPVD